MELRGDYIGVGRGASNAAAEFSQQQLYETAAQMFGSMLDRLAAGYEADPEKRLDLRQEIHLQLWKSFGRFDGRCSVKTWTLRVAHNTAVSYVIRERRSRARLVSLEDLEEMLVHSEAPPDIDKQRDLHHLSKLVQRLKPLDRQILISYLEGLEAASIGEITGLSASNVGMKIHRIKNILARQFFEEPRHES